MNTAVMAAARAVEGRAEAAIRMPIALKVGSVVVLTIVAFFFVRIEGGSPTPLNNLGYAPILLAAYLFGWRGGVHAGVANAFVIGPLPTLLGFPGVETLDSTVARGVFFIGVGGVTGLMIDRSRAAMNGWRSAAVTIAQREREAMIALARGAEAKDSGTADHIGRVQDLTFDLALWLGIEPPRATDLAWSAMLHDVGKLHVPDKILLKPTPLTAREWAIMRRHTIWGAEILANGDGFELARRVARWHHENFDGSGYPDALAHDAIPLEARIVRVTDAFDAMTSSRPYHLSGAVEKALEELDRNAGTHFDPEIVRVFIDEMRRLEGSRAA